jgi:hypothetical protein
MPTQTVYVDPRTLHAPTTRLSGADPVKLQRQIRLLLAAIRKFTDDLTRFHADRAGTGVPTA